MHPLTMTQVMNHISLIGNMFALAKGFKIWYFL